MGAKIAVTEEKGIIPEIGFIGHLFLPFTAGNDYKPKTTGVDFRFSFGHTLNDNSSLSYNLGARWDDDSPEAIYIYTLAYGISLTEKIGFYAELYGDLYVCEDEFWNSPTEKQLRKVTNKLLDLGYDPKPTKIQKVCATIIQKSKKLKW